MEFETLLYEEDDGVATITLNRPEVHNAFNQRMQAELHERVARPSHATRTSGRSS